MATLVLTVIGDDRAGLVSALADVVSAGGGNWEQSQMAELAGKFAGIVTIGIPDNQTEQLTEQLRPLNGILDVTVHHGSPEPTERGTGFTMELVGNDRPGIMQEITRVLRQHEVSIDTLSTHVDDAPMTGGQLFHCQATLRLPADIRAKELRAELEQLAGELMVDLTLEGSEEWE